MKNFDMKYFEDLWAEIDKKENPQQFWDKRAEKFNQKSHTKKNRLTDTLDDLKKKGLCSSDKVLDIGCATGKLAMEIGKIAHRVHGIDISPNMIAYAKENAQEAQMSNLSYEVAAWSEVSLKEKAWEKKFDWVIASMTPGVQDLATLKKMTEASRKHCFISTFVERTNSIEEQLKKKFTFIQPKRDFKNGTYCIFNLLWLQGFKPEIRYINATYSNELTVDEAMNIFAIHPLISVNEKEKIKLYFQEIAVDDKLLETVQSTISFIYWDVTKDV